MHDLIQKIPKAELHLHIEGSLEPEMLLKFSERNKIPIPFRSVSEIKKAYAFKNLQSFLDIYYEGAKVLITEQDFFDLTWAYLLRMHHENTRHVEIFFDPQTHTTRGIPFKTVVSGIKGALDKAKDKLSISSELILCFLRHLSEEDAFKTFEMALPFKSCIRAFGLDSSEKDNPPEKFERVFKKIKAEGFLTVAHAGEEGPPEYIWQALRSLGVSRIDHGVRSIEDPQLVRYLKDSQIPLTVCPLSNVKLCVFPSLESHNLKTLLEKGLRVTLNSDDPSYFGGYLIDNYVQSARSLSLSIDQVSTLAKNSFLASFLPQNEKEKFCKQIDSIVTDYKKNPTELYPAHKD